MPNPDCVCALGIGKLMGRLTIPYGAYPPVEPPEPDDPTPPLPDLSDIPEDYQVTPKAFEDQLIATAGKEMEHNLLVKAVPFRETSNTTGGLTAYIAEEVYDNA